MKLWCSSGEIHGKIFVGEVLVSYNWGFYIMAYNGRQKSIPKMMTHKNTLVRFGEFVFLVWDYTLED